MSAQAINMDPLSRPLLVAFIKEERSLKRRQTHRTPPAPSPNPSTPQGPAHHESQHRTPPDSHTSQALSDVCLQELGPNAILPPAPDPVEQQDQSPAELALDRRQLLSDAGHGPANGRSPTDTGAGAGARTGAGTGTGTGAGETVDAHTGTEQHPLSPSQPGANNTTGTAPADRLRSHFQPAPNIQPQTQPAFTAQQQPEDPITRLMQTAQSGNLDQPGQENTDLAALVQSLAAQVAALTKATRTAHSDSQKQQPPYSAADKAIDKYVTIIAAQPTEAHPSGLTPCINPDCNELVHPGDNFCCCGCHTSIKDFKCIQHDCQTPLRGTVKQMMARTNCTVCFAPLRHSMTNRDWIEYNTATSTTAEATKYTSVPTGPLAGLPKPMHISEADNLRTMLVRSGNRADNPIVGAGARSVYAILEQIIIALNAGIPYTQIFDEKVPFVPKAKLFIAAFKFAFGHIDPTATPPRGKDAPFRASITDFESTSADFMTASFFEWTKAELEVASPIEDWTAKDALRRIATYWSHLTFLLRKTLSDSFADEHKELCDVLMAACLAEDNPKVLFSVNKLFERHSMALAIWRQSTDSWINKSAFFQQYFGEDLEWSHEGTAHQRPKLYVRKLIDGRGQWTKFQVNIFEKPLQQLVQWSAYNYAHNCEGPSALPITGGASTKPPTRQTPVIDVSKKDAPAIVISAHEKRNVRILAAASNLPAFTNEQFTLIENKNAYRMLSGKPLLWPVDPELHKWEVLPFTEFVCVKCYAISHQAKDCQNSQHPSAWTKHDTEAGTDHPTWKIRTMDKAIRCDEANKASAYVKAMKPRKKAKTATAPTTATSAPAADPAATRATKEKQSYAKAATKAPFTGSPSQPTAPKTNPSKISTYFEGSPAPDGRVRQLSMADLEISMHIGKETQVPTSQLGPEAYPIRAKMTITVTIPGRESDKAHVITATCFCRGEKLLTASGPQNKKCRFVIMGTAGNVDAAELYNVAAANSRIILDSGFERAYEHLSSALLADGTAANIRAAHLPLCVRGQMASNMWLRTDFPALLNGQPVLEAHVMNGRTYFQLYLLAATKERSSKLSSNVIHMLAHNDHSYQTQWDASINLDTLAHVSLFLERIWPFCDVSVHLCVQMEDTLAGLSPFIPEYIAWARPLLAAYPSAPPHTGARHEPAEAPPTEAPTLGFELASASSVELRRRIIETEITNKAKAEKILWEVQQAIRNDPQQFTMGLLVPTHMLIQHRPTPQPANTTAGEELPSLQGTPILPPPQTCATHTSPREANSDAHTQRASRYDAISEAAHALASISNPRLTSIPDDQLKHPPVPETGGKQSIFDQLTAEDAVLLNIINASALDALEDHSRDELDPTTLRQVISEWFRPFRGRWADFEDTVLTIQEAANTALRYFTTSAEIAHLLDARHHGDYTIPDWVEPLTLQRGWQPEVLPPGYTPAIDNGLAETCFPNLCCQLAAIREVARLRNAMDSFAARWVRLASATPPWPTMDDFLQHTSSRELTLKIALEAAHVTQMFRPLQPTDTANHTDAGTLAQRAAARSHEQARRENEWLSALQVTASPRSTNPQLIPFPLTTEPNSALLHQCATINGTSGLRCQAWAPVHDPGCAGCDPHRPEPCECENCRTDRAMYITQQQVYRHMTSDPGPQGTPITIANLGTSPAQLRLSAKLHASQRSDYPTLTSLDSAIMAQITSHFTAPTPLGKMRHVDDGMIPELHYEQPVCLAIAMSFLTDELNKSWSQIRQDAATEELLWQCIDAATTLATSTSIIDIAKAVDTSLERTGVLPFPAHHYPSVHPAIPHSGNITAHFPQLALAFALQNVNVAGSKRQTDFYNTIHMLACTSKASYSQWKPLLNSRETITTRLFEHKEDRSIWPLETDDWYSDDRSCETSVRAVVAHDTAEAACWALLMANSQPDTLQSWPAYFSQIPPQHAPDVRDAAHHPKTRHDAQRTPTCQTLASTAMQLIFTHQPPATTDLGHTTADIMLGASAQPHLATTNVVATLNLWRLTGLAYSDAMDLEIEETLRTLAATDNAVQWQRAAREIIRQACILRAVHPLLRIAIPHHIMRAITRLWSGSITTDHCRAVSPSITTFTRQAKELTATITARREQQLTLEATAAHATAARGVPAQTSMRRVILAAQSMLEMHNRLETWSILGAIEHPQYSSDETDPWRDDSSPSQDSQPLAQQTHAQGQTPPEPDPAGPNSPAGPTAAPPSPTPRDNDASTQIPVEHTHIFLTRNFIWRSCNIVAQPHALVYHLKFKCGITREEYSPVLRIHDDELADTAATQLPINEIRRVQLAYNSASSSPRASPLAAANRGAKHRASRSPQPSNSSSPIAALRGDQSLHPLARLRNAHVRRNYPADQPEFDARQKAKAKPRPRRRSKRPKQQPERYAPSLEPTLSDQSSSVSDGEYQRAMQQQGPPRILERGTPPRSPTTSNRQVKLQSHRESRPQRPKSASPSRSPGKPTPQRNQARQTRRSMSPGRRPASQQNCHMTTPTKHERNWLSKQRPNSTATKQSTLAFNRGTLAVKRYVHTELPTWCRSSQKYIFHHPVTNTNDAKPNFH